MNLQSLYERLLNVVIDCGPAGVAFSGGADSSLLLKAYHDVFGTRTLAYFANSILQTSDDLDNAVSVADHIGSTLEVVEIDPLGWPQFTSNPLNRCYYCKFKVYSLFKVLLPIPGMALVDGSNLDDLKQERPGHKAIEELKVLRPLISAELDKTMIRELGKYLDIPSWNRESASCLATRIPEGMAITTDNLKNIEMYENVLKKEGFKGCRVKVSTKRPDLVNIEVKKNDIPAINRPEIWERISKKLGSFGINKLHLEMKGRE